MPRNPAGVAVGLSMGVARASDRSNERIVQAEIARMRQVEDRKIGELAGNDHATILEAEHAGAIGARPAHHVLDGDRAGALDRPVRVPSAVHFTDHVGGLVGGRAVDRERDRASQRCEPFRRRNSRAEPAIRLRTVRHPGAGFGKNADLLVIQVHEVRQPDVAAEIIVIRHPLDRPLAEIGETEIHVGRSLGQMTMDAQAHATGGGRDDLELLSLERPGRRRRSECDAAHAVRRGVVIALRARFDRFDHSVERLGRRRDEIRRVERARLGRAAATEDETYSELLRHPENHMRRVETIAFGIKIMVIGGRCGPREKQLHESDPRGRAQRLLIDLVPIGIGHCAQPSEQRDVDAGTHAFKDALEEMMMRRDEAGIDHAAAGVDEALARRRFERADRRDASIADANRTARAHRLAAQSGEDSLRALDEHGGHASAPTSLSC